MVPQLCLGTAQFGMPYGITNSAGQVSINEVCRIVDLAFQHGIEFFDTAHAYGSAESVLGQSWPPTAKPRLITKLPGLAEPDSWEQSFHAGLTRLQADHLDGFLLHRSADLLGPHADQLLDWMESLRERCLVKRIGVSIYDSSDLVGLPLDRLQLIQLPLSIYDQRLLKDGTISQLIESGLFIHTRSLFLQGLILKPADEWPDFLSLEFRNHHRQLMQHLDSVGLSLLDAALGFAYSCKLIEAVLVGVVSAKEFLELFASWSAAATIEIGDLSHWSWNNRLELDPRNWPIK